MKQEIYVKGYGFLSLAKNMGKSLSSIYGQKPFDCAKKSTTDATTASKIAIQKTAEGTGSLICNNIADKIISVYSNTIYLVIKCALKKKICT